ncbi:hypothetical protein LL912_17700 [Niabella sp. CC-SYL272]|uniref:DUF6734 family protein n=1 Tax=Niabella agricola TaxID=2891571 RepID=UPI001F48E080|nr:DUF6734 family protein [Niabella agricola]MCF3110625.1 hypothetical protein [Niabella agricola]
MTICQTLWVNDKNLLKDSFGWLSPQHHIMGWALSCLKLTSNYSTVNLYTDASGVELFKDELNLPYSSILNEYSKLDVQTDLWAIPKLLTYAKQDEAFLHVDGDVFVWHPFEEKLLSANLIAQNLEKGTGHYYQVFAPLVEKLKYMPQWLKSNLYSTNLRAYNAGILGGSDNAFFKTYVATAMKFIEKNKSVELNTNFNILYEQLLFYSLAKQNKKQVSCLLDKIFGDNGYTRSEVAFFPNANKLRYLHLIGAYKRDKEICDWVARHLFHENPELYLRIIALFKEKHYFYTSKIREAHSLQVPNNKTAFSFTRTERLLKRLDSEISFKSLVQLKSYVSQSENLVIKALFAYEQKIKQLCTKFKKKDAAILKQLEMDSISSLAFLSASDEVQQATVFKRNPYLEVVYSANDWTTLQIAEKGYIGLKTSNKKDIVIGILPEMFFSGFREVALDDISVNLIILAEQEISYSQLTTSAKHYFPKSGGKSEEKSFNELMLLKMEYLITNKILFVVQTSGDESKI